jgi:hypothetical protein
MGCTFCADLFRKPFATKRIHTLDPKCTVYIETDKNIYEGGFKLNTLPKYDIYPEKKTMISLIVFHCWPAWKAHRLTIGPIGPGGPSAKAATAIVAATAPVVASARLACERAI